MKCVQKIMKKMGIENKNLAMDLTKIGIPRNLIFSHDKMLIHSKYLRSGHSKLNTPQNTARWHNNQLMLLLNYDQ